MIDRPKDKEVIESCFVLWNQYNSDGTLERRKTHLVAKGFAQRPGFHYNEIFAPVAQMNSIRLLVALAAREDLYIRHLDITYLNDGDIEEKLLMKPPQFLEEGLESIAEDELDDKTLKMKTDAMLRELRAGDKVF